MGYGYSIRLVELNKEADRKLLGVRLGVSRQTIYNWFVGANVPRATQVELIKNFINQTT